MTDRTVLVTGARGFLGAHAAEEGRARGYEVVTSEDVRFPSDVARALIRRVRPAFVVHAAGPSSVAGSFDAPATDFHASVVATHDLLDTLREARPGARVVYLSSAAVYGNPTRLPIHESDPLSPISPYGFHKQCAETIAREHARLHGLRTASLRIFSAYGPGLRRQVVYDVARRIRAGEPLQMDGTGRESRDFIHAADVARAAFTVLERAPCEGEVYNVASGEETTMRTLAEQLRALIAPGPVTFTGRARVGDPVNWRADVSALTGLGFAAKMSLELGLRQVKEWLSV